MRQRRCSPAVVGAALMSAVMLTVTACSGGEPATELTAQVDPAALPADLTWRTVGGLTVPSSPVDGPVRHSPPEGYSHTPQGAALAAANGQAVLATAGDEVWADTVRTVTAPGPGRDEFAYARAMMSVSGSVAEEHASTFVGFNVTDYSDEQAIVLLATRTPDRDGDSLLTAYPVQMAWTGGDWKLVVPQQSDEVDAVEIDTLDDFTTWEQDT